MGFLKKLKMIITISGKPGSGKTTIAEKIAEKLNYKHISVGDIQGQLALERGITITEMMSIEKENPEIHKQVDQKIKQIGETQENFIIDGWIAYHFIPKSFKIFLGVEDKEGARRIFNTSRIDEPHKETLERTEQDLKFRLNEANEGFKKAYNINFLDKNNYDYILNTTNMNEEQVCAKILEKIKNEENKRNSN